MLTTEDIAKNFPVFRKQSSGCYSYHFGDGKEAHFNEKEQTMVAGTYKPVGALIMQRKVKTLKDVEQFLKDLRIRVKLN